MFTPTTIKAIQDIMRQDIGVDGDATRLSQMVWLIYLKILDDEDKALEIRKEKFVPTLPKKYQWRTWAGPLDGVTGDKLIDFVNNDLLPGLRELPETSNRRTDLTRMAFQDVYNFMRKGTLLKQVINKINEIDFNASKDRHAFNEIYERLLKSLQSAGNFGEMYTPRAVTQFIVEMVNPQLGESVLDPAVGTGGFLVHALEHMRKQVKSVKDEQKIQQSIHGVEKKPLPFMLLITNMMLHGIEEPVTMRRGNTLEKPIRDYTDADKVDCIVTNPPFGGTEEPGIESNFPKEFQTRETADLFLVLIMRLLKKNGRAGLVLPDTFLFGENNVKTAAKKTLLEECNLHTIVRLPKNTFAPYTTIATNILFFTKGEPTNEIWYYEHPYPEGQTSYSMTTPISIDEFEPEKQWWKNRKETEFAWKVPIQEIIKRNYNLDIRNPRAKIEVVLSPQQLVENFRERSKKIDEIAGKIRLLLNGSLSRTGGISADLKFELDNLEDLVRAPHGLDRLSADILMSAVSGKLTHQDKKEGTGEELFKAIELKRTAKENGDKRKRRRTGALPEINRENFPFEIPQSWKWVHLGDIAVVDWGNTSLTKSSYVEKGKYLAVSAAGGDGRISHFEHEPGVIVLSAIGARCGVMFLPTEKFTAIKNTITITPYGWVPEYGIHALNAGAFKRRGGAQPFIAKTDAELAMVPLPPIDEQKRIVKKMEEVMVLIDQLKSTLI